MIIDVLLILFSSKNYKDNLNLLLFFSENITVTTDDCITKGNTNICEYLQSAKRC